MAKNNTPPAPVAPKAPATSEELKLIDPDPVRELEEQIDSLGLKHFRGAELTPYWTRVREGVRNSIPPETLWHKITPTLIVLDAIREALGAPITLLSTYRSPRYNAAVGGEPNSFHMRFMAIDFTADCGAEKLHHLANDMRGRRFQLPGNAGPFIFAGGLGLYRHSNFVHIDCRGYNANWQG